MINKNSIKAALGLPQLDSHITAWLKLDGIREYEIASFNIDFVQPTDHKGEPQGEIRGGQMSITLTQNIEEDIFSWATSYSKRKNGVVEFRVESANAPMKIAFGNGCCVNFAQKMASIGTTGLETAIVISAEEINMNGNILYKSWTEK